VKPVRGTRLIQVTYEGHDPSQDAQIANALIEAYKRQYLQSHYDASSEASDWLTHQLSELKTNVESSEKTLTDFEKDSGILNLPSAAGDSPAGSDIHSVVLEKLDTLNTELTEAEANAIEKESIYRLALTGNYDAISALGASASPASASPAPARTASTAQSANATTLQQLQAKQNDLKVELARQTEIYGTNNRHLKELQLQVSVVDGEIREEMQRIVERSAGDFQIAKRTEGELRQRFDKQQMEAGKLNEKTVQFAVLSQEAASRKKLYEDLYTRLQEANVSAGIKATNITIVDPARAQFNPTRPKKLFNLEVGLLMGLFSGLTFAFIADGIDRTVVNPLEVEEITGSRVLGVIPTFGAKRAESVYEAPSRKDALQKRPAIGNSEAVGMEPIWILEHPESVAAEAFRAVRTAVLLSRAGAAPKVILVTSCIPGEGKSTLTANLAVSFAQHAKKVLIIEADMRRPSMEHVMRIPNQIGLSTVLAGASQLEETILHGIHVPTLDVLPAGPRPPMPSEILGSALFDRLLETLRTLYDIILIDSPPALLLTDAVSISRKTDATIWVARSGVVTRPYLARAAQLIARSGMPSIGFVLNRLDKDADPYGYGYGFGGGYAYGHEYEEPKGARGYHHDA
jgi:capsular exopolysaccharide synthesis family protein